MRNVRPDFVIDRRYRSRHYPRINHRELFRAAFVAVLLWGVFVLIASFIATPAEKAYTHNNPVLMGPPEPQVCEEGE